MADVHLAERVQHGQAEADVRQVVLRESNLVAVAGEHARALAPLDAGSVLRPGWTGSRSSGGLGVAIGLRVGTGARHRVRRRPPAAGPIPGNSPAGGGERSSVFRGEGTPRYPGPAGWSLRARRGKLAERTVAMCGRLLAERTVALPPAFVVDVGLIEGRGWAVVEFNRPGARACWGPATPPFARFTVHNRARTNCRQSLPHRVGCLMTLLVNCLAAAHRGRCERCSRSHDGYGGTFQTSTNRQPSGVSPRTPPMSHPSLHCRVTSSGTVIGPITSPGAVNGSSHSLPGSTRLTNRWSSTNRS